jgi:hypothetical protein
MSHSKQKTNDPAKNPDPITKTPGSHPVGTGVGAAVGGAVGIGAAAATGAAIGSPGGPVGAATGAVVGAVVGGLAGKGIAEDVNPTAEDRYWRDNYVSRPYIIANTSYDQYAPAYRYGWEAPRNHRGKTFDDVERDLGRNWDRVKGQSRLKWEHAKHAARDAWERVAHRHAKP